MEKEMREWANKEDKRRKEEAKERRSTQESNDEEKIAKRVRFMQERVDTEEDKVMQRDIFGEDQPDSKRKDE
eukprot:12382202-Karenia_brevis.AAC.1